MLRNITRSVNVMSGTKTLLELLPKNKEFAIHGKQLRDELGLKRDSEIRAVVNALRREGYPICSNQDGYWLSNNPVEVLETIHSLEHRMVGIAEATEGMYHYLIEEGLLDGSSPN